MDPDDGISPDVSRRDALKKLGIAAGVAWSAPVLMSFSNAAGAATGSPVTTTTDTTIPPDPDCEGATCDSFIACSNSNPLCVCVTTSLGPLCLPGDTPCGIGPPCEPNLSCPPDHFCAIDTCCGFPVCTPLSVATECEPIDARAPRTSSRARVTTAAGTFAGR